MSVENPRLKYLEDVPWEKLLKLSNGKMVHNLEQLPMVIKFSDDEVFDSHVTDQKNDFANWIRDVVGYSELADKILGIRFKEGFIATIEQGIVDAKNYVPPPVVAPISVTVPVPDVTPMPTVMPTPMVAPTPAVAPIVETVLTPVVPLVPVAVPTPVVVPVPVAAPISAPVTPVSPAPVSLASAVVTPSPVSPVVAAAPVVSNPVSPPIIVTPTQSEVKPEEAYDFEEIFKVLLDDVANEIFVWDISAS